MSVIKSQIKWKEVCIGAVFLLGGGICIIVPVTTLQARSLITILLGIILVVLGTSFIWSATESLREKQGEKYKTEDTKGQDTF